MHLRKNERTIERTNGVFCFCVDGSELFVFERGGGMAAAASGGMRGAKSISIFLKIQTSKRLGRSTTIYVPTRLPTYPFQVGYLPVDSSHLPSIHPA